MSSSSYLQELTEAMAWLGRQPDTLFLGQQVACEGTVTRKTFAGVPEEKLIEFPVAENLQMGVAIGLSLEGLRPISFYPRWNFLLLAADQLVNHLDRLPLYSEYRPQVIVRVGIGRSLPLDPGPQHQDDFSCPFAQMLKTTTVYGPVTPGCAVEVYQDAYRTGGSYVITEKGDWY